MVYNFFDNNPSVSSGKNEMRQSEQFAEELHKLL